MREWTLDRRPGKSIVNEERLLQAPRGAKQIVIPMTRPQYDEIWHNAERAQTGAVALPVVPGTGRTVVGGGASAMDEARCARTSPRMAAPRCMPRLRS